MPPVDLSCVPCVAQLVSPLDRVAALQAAVLQESEPLVTLTHLLHLCRDEHRALWEHASDPKCRGHVAAVLAGLADALPAHGTTTDLDLPVRLALSAALEAVAGVPTVVIARALAELIDDRFGHSFASSFRRRSPYQPGVGDPLPLDSPDLPSVMAMRSTSPPWRLANRLDETRRVRLAGEWAVQFRIVFDYGLADTLAGLITRDTVVATCHPNSSLRELDLTRATDHRTFPIGPVDTERQGIEIDRLIGRATAAGASIVLLPELCLTEEIARGLEDWVRRSDGPQLLIAGSFHHEDRHVDEPSELRRRNTAITWVRGHASPLTHDKHSPGDHPVVEDIQPQGWPELRVYVTSDGWHLVIAICRDLLNPQAVHALVEAGVNLVLVPAMSETLMAFGGPAAHLVGASQALVAVANNPGDWTPDGTNGDTAAPYPARALFGHPGLGQLTRLVPSPNSGPGVALLTVHSAQIQWLPSWPSSERPDDRDVHSSGAGPPPPPWVRALVDGTRTAAPPGYGPRQVSLRNAAVLVLLTEGPWGPQVLLTERAADLGDYPGQLVFPGGAAESDDEGPVRTALREAAEEVGLDADSIDVIGLLPALALPESGFVVHPVLAWSQRPTFSRSINYAEVTAFLQAPLWQLAERRRDLHSAGAGNSGTCADLSRLGAMTGTVIDLLLGSIARGNRGREVVAMEVTPLPRSRIVPAGVEGAAR